MKAEQRKELETNALADRMGHLVQRMKTQQRRTALYYVVGAVALFAVMYIGFRWYASTKEAASQGWFNLHIGSKSFIDNLAEHPDTSGTNPGKGALFQYAWFRYWDLGVQLLGTDGDQAVKHLAEAGLIYDELAKQCENDPLWEPEAMYGRAAVEETLAVQNLDHIEVAKKRYEELAKKYPDSARGELAKQWVENYEDTNKRKELVNFYADMRSTLKILDLPTKKGFDIGKTKKDAKQIK